MLRQFAASMMRLTTTRLSNYLTFDSFQRTKTKGYEMLQRMIKCNVSLVFGLGLAVALLWSPGKAAPAFSALQSDVYSVYYVAPSCAGVPDPCFTGVQAAVDAADAPDDIVKIAGGVYTGVQARPAPAGYPGSSVVTQVVYISKTVALQGGYSTSNWSTFYLITQPTTLDAQGQGRVLFIAGDISPTIEGLHITGGDGSGLGGNANPQGDAGGGVYVSDATATIRDCWVFSNTVVPTPTNPNPNKYGGGLYLSASASVITHTEIYSNRAQYGGGIQLSDSDVLLWGNTICDNWAYTGSGVHLFGSHARLVRNRIVDNGGIEGGGVLSAYGAATLEGNLISGNDTIYGGGLLLYDDATTLNGDAILYNEALYEAVSVSGRSDALFTNVIIADNVSRNASCGLNIKASSVRLVHTVIARNYGPQGGIGLDLSYGASVALTNTILVSHTVGISVALGSTVTSESTLWGDEAWANGANWAGEGTINHTRDYTGTPAFVAPDAGDYHIASDSDAIDRGVNAGVTTDIDGEARPHGCFYDIGADEVMTGAICRRSYLPLVLRNYSYEQRWFHHTLQGLFTP